MVNESLKHYRYIYEMLKKAKMNAQKNRIEITPDNTDHIRKTLEHIKIYFPTAFYDPKSNVIIFKAECEKLKIVTEQYKKEYLLLYNE